MQMTCQAEQHCVGLGWWNLKAIETATLESSCYPYDSQYTLLEAPTKLQVSESTCVMAVSESARKGVKCIYPDADAPVSCKTKRSQVVTKAGGFQPKVCAGT